MENKQSFYTLKGYTLIENKKITASMEDYLEMIYRQYLEGTYIRINRLAESLHVKPSSASKMVNNLKENDLVDFQPYGNITLTDKGINLGRYLLYRHDILSQFLCFLNQSEDETEIVEKIEHFIDYRTILSMEHFLEEKNGY